MLAPAFTAKGASVMSRKAKVLILALVCALLVPLAGTAARAARPPARQLVDYQQSTCYRSGTSFANYYGVWVKGTWKRALGAGVSGLPAGGTTWTSYVPIPPGSSDGVGSLAYVAVQIPASTPIGSYTAQLWASDGRTTESVPVTLVVKAKCTSY